MKLLFTLLWRGVLLVGCGWLVDRFFHTGWLLGICVLSLIDREASWILEEFKK
jgi:F0F1-type ATP synthase assembly protein I